VPYSPTIARFHGQEQLRRHLTKDLSSCQVLSTILEQFVNFTNVIAMTGSANRPSGRQAVPALSPVNNIPDWATAQEMQLFITNPDNSFPPGRAIAILPLTVGAGLNASSVARAVRVLSV
jgi:hypothetical protein